MNQRGSNFTRLILFLAILSVLGMVWFCLIISRLAPLQESKSEKNTRHVMEKLQWTRILFYVEGI
ncbi:hypothetical protein LX64_02714 [Chitinophaga skermanii]|uniref:Uncharacterized protein n=2 Tax=Chitinophaga skermanii TaxID=331697 RepID=A0A327QPZ0_9BACT|nr:hypothetical protein LX64_02714 [Chitinophaga skermanii]